MNFPNTQYRVSIDDDESIDMKPDELIIQGSNSWGRPDDDDSAF